MRLSILALAAALAAPAAFGAASAAAPDPAAQPDRAASAIVRNADGSVTITEAIRPDEADLEPGIEALLMDERTSRAAPGPGGEMRSRSAEEADEALDDAFEEAVDMARMAAGPD